MIRTKLVFLMALVIVISVIASLPFTALASMEELSSITVHVRLYPDGSAQITEVWVARGISGGTEFYIPIGNLDSHMVVSDLTVSDSSGTVFETVQDWNTDWSFYEKSYRCGLLVTDDGFEICWGISSMGDNEYTVSYKLSGLVRTYPDGVGIAHQFVTHGISSPPQEVIVTIGMDGVAFSEENTFLQTSGFDGVSRFDNGTIVVYTTAPFNNRNYINILAGFPSGIFHAPPGQGNFADLQHSEAQYSTAQRNAEGGVNIRNVIRNVLMVVSILAGMALFITIGSLAMRNIRLDDGSRERRPSMKNVAECRTIPFNGSIPVMSWVAGTSVAPELWGTSSPFEAYLVKWECRGDIVVLKQEQAENSKRRPEQAMQFTRTQIQADAHETALYKMLRQAADKDGILREPAFVQWAKENAKKMVKWDRELREFGKDQATISQFAGPNKRGKTRLTRRGMDELRALLGLSRFLNGIDDQNAVDVQPLWHDYLVFATLFKMHKKVASRLYAADSLYFAQIFSCRNEDLMLFLAIFHYGMFTDHSAGIGSSSSGGGGGFSGGGGGGGIR